MVFASKVCCSETMSRPMFRVEDSNNNNDVEDGDEDDLVEPLTEVFGDHFKADILDRCAW